MTDTELKMPEDADFEATPESVRAYIQQLEFEIDELRSQPAPSAQVEGDVGEVPLGAIENGREYFRRLTEHYDFQDSGGHKIDNCYEFEQLKLCFETIVSAIQAAQLPKPEEVTVEELEMLLCDFDLEKHPEDWQIHLARHLIDSGLKIIPTQEK